MEKPKKKDEHDQRKPHYELVEVIGYNKACDKWEAYLESISEQKLYCAILDVQEEIELGGTSLNLLQSHRKLMAKAIKNMIDGGK